MNTKKILLVSSDKELIDFIKISSLILTKLNCQVTVDISSDYEAIKLQSKESNLNLIIIDLQETNFDTIKLITNLRKNKGSKSKKIISLYLTEVNKSEIYNAGCDSIMSKEEFRKSINNIFQF